MMSLQSSWDTTSALTDQFLSFTAPVIPQKIWPYWVLRWVYFIEAIGSTLFRITGVINEKSYSHSTPTSGSWFAQFSRVLPTSCIGFYAGKPIESAGYWL